MPLALGIGLGPTFGGALKARFVGPLDGLPAVTVAYSVRRLLTSYVANKAVNVRRNSDQGTLDIGFLANGDLDVPSLTTFLNATTGAIAIWYDQSGNGMDVSQATAAKQPTVLSPGHYNSKTSIVFTAASAQELTRNAAVPALTGDVTMAALSRPATNPGAATVACRDPGAAANGTFGWRKATGKDLLTTPNVVNATASATLGETIGTNYIAGFTRSGSNITYYQNGAANGTATLAPAGATVQWRIGGQGASGSASLNDEMPEILVWDSVISGPNLTALFANMNAYYTVF